MRNRFVASFVGASLLNSWALAAVYDQHSIADRVGAAAKCKDDCSEGTASKSECLHTGNFDPCSSITCIKNVVKTPSCSAAATGGIECPTESGDGGTQTNYDEPCSGTSGWAIHEFQAKGDCAPRVAAWMRCLAGSCGAGTGYAEVTRNGPVCK